MTLAAPVFWGSVALVAYAYVGYPLLVWALRRTPTSDRTVAS